MPAKRLFPDKVCQQCSKAFNRHLSPSGRLKSTTDYQTRRFCSPTCGHEFHQGSNHHLYKPEGSRRKDGYIRVAVAGKRKYLHRHLMEVHLGRPLTDSEDVHHEDENPSNNALDNLILTDSSTHGKIHYSRRIINSKGQFTCLKK